MVSKNWWLFGAGLSSFWRWEKRVRGWPEQKNLIGFLPEQKKRGKRMGWTPYCNKNGNPPEIALYGNQ
jgi:hypothetical protein